MATPEWLNDYPRAVGTGRYFNETAVPGSVSSVATGTGLAGGPITTTGTISLADTAVTPGTYITAIFIRSATGNFATGNSNFVVYVWYEVIDL
jgi:hypothetical protein